MHRIWSLAAFISAAALACSSVAVCAADGPVVQTTAGSVSGTGGDVRAFKGIPFAAPPVGPLRWKAPEPAPMWTGVRDATAFGAECMQPGPPGTPMSEDCLTLNVWTPAAAAHLPVIVYIYGGGYAVGGSSNPVADGTSLARHGVVVVTMNYRLNVLGFLALPALTTESPERTSGNYGLLDQLAALRWVRANVAAFGGDPRNVTIMGESAGAGSVSALMTMPRARGMFARAIMESAPVFRPELGLAEAERAGTMLTAGASLADLRAMAPADLIKRIPPLDPDTRSDLPVSLGPIADNVVIPEEHAAYAAGKQAIVPIIIGNNALEGSFFARGVPVKTLAAYDAALHKRFGTAAPKARELWPASDDAGALVAESTIVGDLDINTGVRKMAIAMARAGVPVYRYLFTRTRDGKVPGHSDELPYVFGTPNVGGVGQPAPPFDTTDTAVSERMETMWTQFAKTGNPNPPGTNAWPRYTVTGDRFIVFGDTVGTGTAFRSAQLDFLNSTVGR